MQHSRFSRERREARRGRERVGEQVRVLAAARGPAGLYTPPIHHKLSGVSASHPVRNAAAVLGTRLDRIHSCLQLQLQSNPLPTDQWELRSVWLPAALIRHNTATNTYPCIQGVNGDSDP